MMVLALYLCASEGIAYVEVGEHLIDEFLDWVVDGDAPAFKFTNGVIAKHDCINHFFQV